MKVRWLVAYFFVAQNMSANSGRGLEVGSGLRVDTLLVPAGELEQVPDLGMEVGERREVLGLEVVGPDDLDLVLHLLRVLLLDGDAADERVPVGDRGRPVGELPTSSTIRATVRAAWTAPDGS